MESEKRIRIMGPLDEKGAVVTGVGRPIACVKTLH
jgi:hypothetical protein